MLGEKENTIKMSCRNCLKIRNEAMNLNLKEWKTIHKVTKIKNGYRMECMTCGQVSFKLIKPNKLEVK